VVARWNEIVRKRIEGSQRAEAGGESEPGWLNLEQIATVEVTSEHPSFPVESALGSGVGPGWRASQKGAQQIRIIFDEPASLHRIQLRFDEAECERTQEFTIRWSSAASKPSREIVRQTMEFQPCRLNDGNRRLCR
jgi:hypothetical protein